MDFNAAIKKGPSKKAPRILLIGVEGVGKSSAGAQLPSPIFLCGEDGLVGPQFADTPSYTPKDWVEALSFLDWIALGNHQYKSIVIDTLDWIEPKLFAHVVASAKKADIKSIEDFGYGKGYAIAADEFRQLLSRLDKVNSKGILVLILAHSQVKAFNNPIGDNYDRYEPKVAKQIAGLAKEWVDAVLFARFDTWSKKDGGKAKGFGGQVRVVHTTHCAAWDAKNRYGLPDTLALDMPTILEAIKKGQPAQLDDMIAELTELAEHLPQDKKTTLKDWLSKGSYTATQLAQSINRVRASINEQPQEAQ
jgi:hypothetical protein